MDNEWVFLLPGRVRLKVPGLKGNKGLAHKIAGGLAETAGITRVTANPLTGKILVHYNQALVDHASIIVRVEEIRNGNAANYGNDAGISGALVPVREPEDLPLARQVFQVVISGTVLLVLFFKHRVIGKSSLSYSKGLFNLANITTLATGYPIIASGLQQLAERRRVNYDLVISAVTLSLLVLRESFTGLLVTWLVNLSGLIQTLNLMEANKTIRDSVAGLPSEAWKVANGVEKKVSVSTLTHGDIITVMAGEVLPVDGTVVSGRAYVDESRITGVPEPLYRESGTFVLAGTTVLDGTLEISVTSVGRDTHLYRAVDAVYRQNRQVSSEYFESHYDQSLVSVSLMLAGLVYLLTRNLNRPLAMLLAACPSAAGLAVPGAVGSAVGRAANRGIYVKDGGYLLAAGRADTVVFDKTGTMTNPNVQTADVIVTDKQYSKEDIVALATLAEGLTGHPIAEAIRKKAREMHIGPLPATESIQVFPGMGVQAGVNHRQVLVGNARLMRGHNVSLRAAEAKVKRIGHLGMNPVFLAVDNKLRGILGIREELKPESQKSIAMLRAGGVKHIILLTGDPSNSAATLAGELGIEESHSDLTQEQKAEFICNLKRNGHIVAMVGDGLNDALAMAQADVGIALGCTGVQSAACAGGIVIPSDNPLKAAEIVCLGQETREIVKQNYNFAAGLNIIGLALGAAGLITPLSAGLYINIGTVAVIFNSMRLLKESPGKRVAKHKPRRLPPRGRGGNTGLPEVSGVSAADCIPAVTGWHAMAAEDVIRQLGTGRNGLSSQEREVRSQKFGPNLLSLEKKVSWVSLFLEPFKDFMTQLMLGAGAVSLIVGEYADALTIIVIVGVEAVIGVIQGLKAEKSLSALKKLAAPTAMVVTGGRVIEEKADQLVPGDIVLLSEGDSIPADCRLLEVKGLEVDESALTGESVPVAKDTKECESLDIMLADRANMVFMGTGVTKGNATALVTGTGMSTEMGRLAMLLQESEADNTPLQNQLEQLGKQISLGCLAVCGAVVGAGILRGRPLMEMLKTGVSLAVGAIPEGLPAIVTISLAFGVQRMVKGNAIVRRLPSVETLGNATVICTDKTGTLTQNKMTVTEIYCGEEMWQVTGSGYAAYGEFIRNGFSSSPLEDKGLCRILTAAALCNNSDLEFASDGELHVSGDPTEAALLVAAVKGGIPWPDAKEAYCRNREISFDSTRKMMTVICHDTEGNASAYTKGAPDYVLSRCSRVYKGSRVAELDLKARNKIIAANEEMAAKALRVLAVAYKPLDSLAMSDEETENGLIFLGLMGIVDPPRHGVYEAVQKCRQAGLKVVMVTGDHPTTAKAIASQLSIYRGGAVITGREIDHMSDEELSRIIDCLEVCSRTTPEHKLRIVKAFKQRGHIVAMTGDGVNDAPAVKEADIGIAMGRKGTDVTREASDITLADDNFATIITAVKEGRTVGDNIRKSIRYVLAGNFGEVLAIFLAAASGMPMPLVPSQILWVNLATESVPAMALGADPPDSAVMVRPPRPADENILTPGITNSIAAHGILTGLTTFGVFTATLLAGGSIAKARTMAFANMVVSQLFHLFDCRKQEEPDAVKEEQARNKLLVPSAGASGALLLAAIYVPGLSPLFQTVPLGLTDWALLSFTSGFAGRLDNLFFRNNWQDIPVQPVPALPAGITSEAMSLEDEPEHAPAGTISLYQN